MDKETLKYVLTQSTTRPLPPATPRMLELPLDSKKIVALVGIRRSGKTFLLYETMRRLEATGVDRRQLVYLNFEDDRLFVTGSSSQWLSRDLATGLRGRSGCSSRMNTRPASRRPASHSPSGRPSQNSNATEYTMPTLDTFSLVVTG